MLVTSKKIRRLIVLFILAPLIIPVSLFPSQKVHAVVVPVPIAEVGPVVPIHTGNLVENTLKAAKEYVLDNLVTVLAKTLIKQITRSTIQWINSGFKGGPSFIQNPDQFFTGIADRVAGDFIESIGLGFLCEPFRLDLQLSLALEYGGGGGGGSFTDEIGCTFSDVAGNIEGFVQGDFTQGGWDGFFKVTQNRNNNPYGAYLSAKSALDIKISSAQGTERLVLDWGKGFKSLTDGLGNILTPGATIEAQLSDVLGTDLAQLELADEINEIMGALAGQLLTQIMSATGLAGGGGSSYSQGYSTLQEFDSEFSSDVSDAQDQYSTEQENLVSSITQDFENGAGAGFNLNNDTNETGTFNIGLRSESTKQSGTFESYFSEKVVDGNTSGNINNVGDRGSVSITDIIENPWWQIDLKNDTTDPTNPAKQWAIGKIEIFPRTSDVNNTTALGDFRIFVSSKPITCNFASPYLCTTNNGLSFNPVTQPTGLTNDIFATPPLRMPSTGTFSMDLNITGKFFHVQRIDATTLGRERIQLAEVKIFRNNAPVITLIGSNTITLRAGEQYVEEGATAFDQSDADRNINAGAVLTTTSITKDNVSVPSVDTNAVGQYVITYTATDSGGAVAKKTRRVTVIENTTQSAN